MRGKRKKNRSESEMPIAGVQLSAIERKLQNHRNGGVSVKRTKSFNSMSAPTSPSAHRRNKQPTLEPRYTKSTYLLIEAKRLAKELEERKKQGSLLLRPQSAKTVNLGSSLPASKHRASSTENLKGTKRPITADTARTQSPPVLDGRMTPLRNSGRRRNFVLPLPISNKTCDECERPVQSNYYSEHRGLPYCNVPCYSSLFSSVLGRGNETNSSSSSLSKDHKQLRTTLMPKLRTYNTYYSNKPCQICCREANGKFVLEGILKIYWGLGSSVTLVDSDVSHYWNHFQPEDGGSRKNENNENAPPTKTTKTTSAMRRAKNALQSHQLRYNYKRKTNSEHPKKRIGCSACNHEFPNYESNSTFVPPYGSSTTLRLTNHMTTPAVVDMLLKKFQIEDSRKRFTLFTVYESGGQRRLPPDSFPLLTRLSLGPCEDVAKIFIMEAADQMDIPLEVAQYINFSTQVLETFVKKFYEEEEREVDRIREKYNDYKDLLNKRLDEFKRNNVTTV